MAAVAAAVAAVAACAREARPPAAPTCRVRLRRARLLLPETGTLRPLPRTHPSLDLDLGLDLGQVVCMGPGPGVHCVDLGLDLGLDLDLESGPYVHCMGLGPGMLRSLSGRG